MGRSRPTSEWLSFLPQSRVPNCVPCSKASPTTCQTRDASFSGAPMSSLPLSHARESLCGLVAQGPRPPAPGPGLLLTACLNVPRVRALWCELAEYREAKTGGNYEQGREVVPVTRGSYGARGRPRGERHLGRRPGFQLWGLRKGRAWQE